MGALTLGSSSFGRPGLYLIRHGETEWSRSGKHTGRTDVPLTARGEDEAREVGRRLSGVPFTKVVSSPSQRARATSELAALGPPTEVDPDLAEWDYGDYEGLRSVDIRQRRPDWNLFRDGCPGGESPSQVAARADRVIERLRHPDGAIAVITHGHLGRVIGARWIGLELVEAEGLLFDTGAVSILGFEYDDPNRPALVLWNS